MASSESETGAPAWGGFKPRFSPEINLGHLLQALALVLTVGGGAVACYISLRGDIEAQRGDLRAAIVGFEARIETQRSELRIAMAGFETRLNVAEHAIAERQADERDFAAEMRAALLKISDQLSDLRVQVVRPRTSR